MEFDFFCINDLSVYGTAEHFGGCWMNAERFYLFIYSIALRTMSLILLDMNT